MARSEVQVVDYNTALPSLRREIATLQDLAYGTSESASSGRLSPLHVPALNARSCFIRSDGWLVSYASVVTKAIVLAGQTFTISGLSCVATDPYYRHRGLARRVVAAATAHIERSGVDFGVFTCDPELARLYASAGSWSIAPNVVLVGSRDPSAITSSALGVVVLMRLFSTKAHAVAGTLLRGTIDLDLPVGHFW